MRMVPVGPWFSGCHARGRICQVLLQRLRSGAQERAMKVSPQGRGGWWPLQSDPPRSQAVPARMRRLGLGLAGWLMAIGSLSPYAHGEDWPQWGGPRRDGTSPLVGQLRGFPEGGLPKLWSAEIGGGYSGPAIASGRVLVSDFRRLSGESTNSPDQRDRLEGEERLLCFAAGDGTLLWQYARPRVYNISYPAGPRATPTIDENRVYFLGAEGDLACLAIESGEPLWELNLPAQFGGEVPIWGHAAHPLVYGELLICLAGGSGSVVVALDKETGQVRWQHGTAQEIGYCPPTILRAAGVDQLLIWDSDQLQALVPTTGEPLWSTPLVPRYGMSIAPPVISGERMFVSGIGETAAMYRIDGERPGVETLWSGRPKMALYAANCTPAFVGDHVYGADCGSGQFVCFRASDGQRMWETLEPTAGGSGRKSHASAFMIRHENRALMLSETGDLILAQLNPQQYQELARTPVIEPTGECFGRPVVWAYPAIAGGRLWVRNDQQLICYQLTDAE